MSSLKTGWDFRIELDSVNPYNGKRITTFVCTIPRRILVETNTHSAISKNAASIRAIPAKKIIEAVERDPFIPVFAKANTGMITTKRHDDQPSCKSEWLDALSYSIKIAKQLLDKHVGKDVINSLLTPFMWTTQIMTATEWDNYFALRCHATASWEFQYYAINQYMLYRDHVPIEQNWHIPFVEYSPNLIPSNTADLLVPSIAACARVSYDMVDGSKRSYYKDLILYKKLLCSFPKHVSPATHQAYAEKNMRISDSSRNFRGWQQYRTMISTDTVTDLHMDQICEDRFIDIINDGYENMGSRLNLYGG